MKKSPLIATCCTALIIATIAIAGAIAARPLADSGQRHAPATLSIAF